MYNYNVWFVARTDRILNRSDFNRQKMMYTSRAFLGSPNMLSEKTIAHRIALLEGGYYHCRVEVEVVSMQVTKSPN